MNNNIRQKLGVLETTKQNIRTAINTFVGDDVLTTSTPFADYPGAIRDVVKPLEPVIHGVNYYNYEGDLLYTYTPEEFLRLTTHPSQDSTDTLEGQGWNWTLADAKDFIVNGCDLLNIGGLYITKDRKTHIYIDIPEGGLEPYLMTVCVGYWCSANSSITFDWGDGTDATVVSCAAYTGSNTTKNISVRSHIYSASGKYDISITPGSGLYYSVASTANNSFVGYASTQARFADQYIRAIELGERFIWEMGRLGYYATNLEYVSVPIREVPNSTFDGNLKTDYCFENCTRIKAIIIPDGIKGLGRTNKNNFATNCPKCKCICIPNSVDFVYASTFTTRTYGLDSLVFPSNCAIEGTTTNSLSTCRRICLPKNTTSTTLKLFNNNYIFEINIPEGITSTTNNEFGGCDHQRTLIYPSTITSLGTQALTGLSLMNLVCRATTPPTLNATQATATQLTNQGLKIHVPYSADHSILDAYKAATNWSTYASLMREMDVVNDNYIKVNLVEKVDNPGSYYCLIKEISLGWWVDDLTNYPPKIYINGQLTTCTVTAGTDKVVFEYTSGEDTVQITVNLKNGYPQNATYGIPSGDGNWIKLSDNIDTFTDSRGTILEIGPDVDLTNKNDYPDIILPNGKTIDKNNESGTGLDSRFWNTSPDNWNTNSTNGTIWYYFTSYSLDIDINNMTYSYYEDMD